MMKIFKKLAGFVNWLFFLILPSLVAILLSLLKIFAWGNIFFIIGWVIIQILWGVIFVTVSIAAASVPDVSRQYHK